MSGSWHKLWDEDRQKWVDVWIDLPSPIRTGTATPTSGKDTQILGPDGKPLVRPRRIGFQR